MERIRSPFSGHTVCDSLRNAFAAFFKPFSTKNFSITGNKAEGGTTVAMLAQRKTDGEEKEKRGALFLASFQERQLLGTRAELHDVQQARKALQAKASGRCRN